MTTSHVDATIAARVPQELRQALEAKRDELAAAGEHYPDGRPVDLSYVIRRACRAYVNGHTGLFQPTPGTTHRYAGTAERAAAKHVAPRAGSQRLAALTAIALESDRGLTVDEVLERLEARATRNGARPPAINSIARRVTDLAQAGAIEPVPHPTPSYAQDGIPLTRLTRHGAQATVYTITTKGRQWLEQARKHTDG